MRQLTLLSVVLFVLMASVPAAHAKTWSQRTGDFKKRFEKGFTSIKEELSQWPGIIAELPGAYVDTLQSGDQLRSVGAIPGKLAQAAQSVGSELAAIPGYAGYLPGEYWRSLENGSQADTLSGLVDGALDRATLGLLNPEVGARFGNTGSHQTGEAIGAAVVDAEVGTVIGAGVAYGAGKAAGAIKSAVTAAQEGTSLLGVESGTASARAAAEEVRAATVAETEARKARRAAALAAARADALEQATAQAARAAEFAAEPLATQKIYDTKGLLKIYQGESVGASEAFGKRAVVYFTDAQRAAARLFVRDGKLYDATGKLFHALDTGHGGRAIFVMDACGNFYAMTEHAYGMLHHSSLLAGQAVAGAGEMSVNKGVLQWISNQSGHYKPTVHMLTQAVQRLESLGVNTSNVPLNIVAGSPVM